MGINPIEWFAKTEVGTRFYKWAASEKGQKFTATTLPTLESVAAGVCYVAATECQKNLDRREKNVLQWQNVLSSICGITIGSYLNKKAFDFGEKVIKHLDPNKVPDLHKSQGAIRVLGSIVLTALTMRFAMPVITAFASGEIEERRSKNKLDIKA